MILSLIVFLSVHKIKKKREMILSLLFLVYSHLLYFGTCCHIFINLDYSRVEAA